MNYHSTSPKKLRSPIFDGLLNDTIFTKPKILETKKEKDTISHSQINSLETSFKIASILICSTGGIISLLELINIITTIQSGNSDIGNSLIGFTIAFICTIVANIVCIGFIHLIRVTRYLYSNFDSQKVMIEKLITSL